ncbi:MAG: hypothetical protein IJY07_01940 [Clostridia bacterium]|nr:hypothetical protein [Clostridia bacterium]
MTIYKEHSHSIERSKQRKNLNPERAERDIVLAWVRGKTASDFYTQKRQYLETVESENDIKKAYDGYCYVFTKRGYCKTMYQLPRWFSKPTRYDGGNKIRNMKKHAKYNPRSVRSDEHDMGYSA